jgi:hypothetical protein
VNTPHLLPRLACLLPVLAAPGCCSLARLFCGPDKSEWVQIGFATPEATVKTFLEAIRRDDPSVISLCLGQDYKQRTGLDLMTINVAWEQMKAKVTGIHLAGYASVPPAQPHTGNDATIHLDIEGHPLDIDLHRSAYWEASYLDSRGVAQEPGASAPSLDQLAHVQAQGDEESTLQVAPQPLKRSAEDVATLLHFAIGYEWKIADLRTPERAP